MISPKPLLPLRVLPWLPTLLAFAALAVNLWLIDLKGITTDEGFRLWITNGGQPRAPHPTTWPNWGEVLAAINPYAYQPGFYLLQNSLMRLFERQDLLFFRLTNLAFLAISLGGLLALAKSWSAWPRAFLVGLFSFNAYLIMHILQIREYPAAMAFYIWSTALVLHLDGRPWRNDWTDLACFLGYGLLLTAGFYLQTWVVFPAIGQGAFLILRRRSDHWKFHAHLALSYLVVFSLTWPYLQSHGQKINIGLWERAQVTLSGQLTQGFALVFSGHLPGDHWFTNLLPWAWIGLMLVAGWWILRHRTALPLEALAETSRQVWLMALCMAFPLAFQIGYFFKVEPLSVWPRYFIVHYFFLVWLIALAFRTLHTARAARPGHRLPAAGLVSASALLAFSAVYQVRSFRENPYFDTSLSPASDWRFGVAAALPLIHSDDALVSHDFITASVISFSQALPCPVLLGDDLERTDLTRFSRLVCLEAPHYETSTGELAARLKSLGFAYEARSLLALDGQGVLPGWRILIFTRS